MSINRFVLQEIIDELINPEKTLVGPLMKLNYFGKLIRNTDLVDFTNNEINGYNNFEDKVPPYRKTPGTLTVDAQAYLNRHNSLQIPFSLLEPPFNDALRYIEVRDGISTVEKLAKEMIESKGDKEQFYRPIPMEMLNVIQRAMTKLYKNDVDLVAIGARVLGNGNVMIQIPNSVRTRLLDFVMQIAEQFGLNIELSSFNKETSNNEIINNIMNTTINTSGDGNVINTGNNNSIKSEVSIKKGNQEKLVDALREQGVDETDIQELVEIVSNESPTTENRLGTKANGWIGKTIEKSLNGIGKIATGVSSNLLAGLIRGYYGLDNLTA